VSDVIVLVWRTVTGDPDLYLLCRFLEHPWSKIPDTFLNLEGAASGGYVFHPNILLPSDSLIPRTADHSSSEQLPPHPYDPSQTNTSPTHTRTSSLQMPMLAVSSDREPTTPSTPKGAAWKAWTWLSTRDAASIIRNTTRSRKRMDR